MSHYLIRITFLSLVLSLLSVRASDLLQTKIQEVSSSKYWKNLIHFNYGLFKSESYADSSSFFISSEGKYNLAKELEANIDAFKRIERKFTPQSIPAQCAFPERYNFIKKEFPEIDFIEVDCPHFNKWKSAVIGESVSLVFASSFVNNPSSMFGHTFLKLNKYGNDNLSEDMFDYVVAYSAKAEDKPGLLYAIKGLFGGYKGIVDVQPFYQTLREYSKVESRDIWEYRLKLDAKQIDSLVNHIWELYANTNFDYYFFDENCTSVLARILSLVSGDDLDSQMSGYALPTDFLRSLINREMIDKVSYHPSLRKQFFTHYDNLDDQQKNEFTNIFKNKTNLGDKETFNSLVHYYDYIRHDHENEVSSKFQERQREVLSLSAKKGKLDARKVSRPASPESGHLPARIDLAFGNEDSNAISVVTIRPTFHALIDPGVGYEPWSHIELFKLSGKYQFSGQKTLLESLTVADIQSLPDFKMLDTNTSWSLDLKLLPLYEEGRVEAYKGSFNLNMGISKHNDLFLFSFLTGATLEGHSSFKNKVKLGPNIKINLGANIFKTRLILESRYSYSLISTNSKRDYLQTKLQLNSAITSWLSLKLEGASVSKYGNLLKAGYSRYLVGLSMYY